MADIRWRKQQEQPGGAAGGSRSVSPAIASLDWARTQQAKSWELRTATSCARLMHDQGRVREAYDLLAPIYGWFTEGLGTKDLKEAKALLEELARAGDSLCYPPR